MLQRSVTSSAILVNSTRGAPQASSARGAFSNDNSVTSNCDNSEINNGSDTTGGGGGYHQHQPSTNGVGGFSRRSDGVTGTNDDADCSGANNTPQSSKFSVPSLFKKLRSGVTPSKFSLQTPVKQSYVHPKGASDRSDNNSPNDREGRQFRRDGDSSVPGSRKNNVSANQERDHDGERHTGSQPTETVKAKSADAKPQQSLTNGSKYKNGKGSTGSRLKTESKSSFEKENKKSSKSKASTSKESGGKRFQGLVVSPTSPKPLVRALGRLKFRRGTEQDNNNGGGTTAANNGGGTTAANNGGCGEGRTSRNQQMNPLQKSSSVGHSMFATVVQDCGE